MVTINDHYFDRKDPNPQRPWQKDAINSTFQISERGRSLDSITQKKAGHDKKSNRTEFGKANHE
jgi:hypothetical protein